VDFSELIQTVLTHALPVIFAITLHEAAHGMMAYRLGDNTAYMMGRVTLNPVPHIDPVGTLLMPALLYLLTQGHFLFGYAKPVPVRYAQLNHPKRDMVWVALAGPASNFIQALLWGVALYSLLAAGVQERFFVEMCQAGVMVNVVLCVFNLFPLPPLDGGRVLVGVLPWRAAVSVSRIEPYGMYIVMALVVFKIIDTLWMLPLMHVSYEVLDWLLTPFQSLIQH
jgi:Zn-dependent protease